MMTLRKLISEAMESNGDLVSREPLGNWPHYWVEDETILDVEFDPADCDGAPKFRLWTEAFVYFSDTNYSEEFCVSSVPRHPPGHERNPGA